MHLNTRFKDVVTKQAITQTTNKKTKVDESYIYIRRSQTKDCYITKKVAKLEQTFQMKIERKK